MIDFLYSRHPEFLQNFHVGDASKRRLKRVHGLRHAAPHTLPHTAERGIVRGTKHTLPHTVERGMIPQRSEHQASSLLWWAADRCDSPVDEAQVRELLLVELRTDTGGRLLEVLGWEANEMPADRERNQTIRFKWKQLQECANSVCVCVLPQNRNRGEVGLFWVTERQHKLLKELFSLTLLLLHTHTHTSVSATTQSGLHVEGPGQGD